MAAQEYYQGAGASAPTPTSAPTSRPPAQSVSNPPHLQAPPANPPYPLYDGPPPPYSPGGERTHSQPPPQRRPLSNEYPQEKQTQQRSQQPPRQQPSPRPPQEFQPRPVQPDYDAQFRPPVRQQHSYAYPEEKRNGFQQQGGYQPPYGAQPVQPPYTNGYSGNGHGHGNNVAFAPTPQYRYPSRSRSRSRSRDRSKKNHQRKKSSGINTFLGAGGGALIGDAIFPGLGTIGGAILGGFGGHEYGKQKKDGKHRERRYSDDYDYRPSRR